MVDIHAHPGGSLPIGRRGENLARLVIFDLAPWRKCYGDGTVQLLHQRAGDADPYPCTLTVEGDVAYWLIRAADVDKPGWGDAQLHYYVGETLAKSAIWRTVTADALGDPSEPPEDPAKAWFAAIREQIGNLDELTTKAKDNLVAAINEAAKSGGGGGSVSMRVDNGYIQYSTDGGASWDNLIATADLRGAKGDPGTDGKDGTDGTDGTDGKDGITPHIGDNGNWYLGDTDTGKPSRGETGQQGPKGDAGETGPQGPQGEQGPQGPTGPAGADGKDGAGMDITGATVDQIAKITAVDDSGKPTAWEAVDMPSGGGSAVELDATLSEAGKAADAKAVGDALSMLSEENAELKDDLASLTLGIHTDGLLYIFHKGAPIGSGVSLPSDPNWDVYGNVDSENNIIVTGALADGTYTVKYEMEDGRTIDIGELVLDNNVYYSITNNLTNCVNSNSATQAIKGESYSATITANDGYTLSSVVVTMGGVDITASVVSGGVISIANVTGDIVITAVAEEAAVEPSYTNVLPLSVKADNTPYIGDNGEDGYNTNKKISTSSGSESTASACVSGFIKLPEGVQSKIYIKNITVSSSASINNLVFYNTSKEKMKGYAGITGAFNSAVTVTNGVYLIKTSEWFANNEIPVYFRFSCGEITEDTIVTINEEIV